MNNSGAKGFPTVSVVIATYNRAQMVKEAVLAAWNQTLRPTEIVVSDDCSPDNTLEVLRQLQSEVPILRIVESVKNSGGVPNWNQVIEASNGDIVAWCSDDDRFLPEHLERVVKYMQDHDDVGLVHAGFVNVEQMPDGSENRSDSILKGATQIPVDVHSLIPYMTKFYNWPFHPSTWVFRRSLWQQVGPFNKIYALADTDWFIRAALGTKIVYLPTLDVLNRRHAGNWSNRVGAVGMQREFHAAMKNFVGQAAARGHGGRAASQFKKWLGLYRQYLMRIFISRSRAGQREMALECAKALTEASPALAYIPAWSRGAATRLTFSFLYALQTVLPGGRGKYKNIGVTVP